MRRDSLNAPGDDVGPHPTVVRRRHVFFLSGFDPKGAAHYHRIYRTQSLLQGVVTGKVYEVSERKHGVNGNAVWTIRSGDTETVYEYVRWDDVVRAHWPRGIWQVLVNALQVYALVLTAPQPLYKIWGVARRTLVALFYPALYWMAVLGLASLVGLLLTVGAEVGAQVGLEWAGLQKVVGAVASAGVVCAGWWLEQRLHTSWLLRIFSFADHLAKGRVPELSERWDGVSSQIRQTLLRPEIDEVLLVGFSVGSMGAVSVAARTLQGDAMLAEATAKLSVLTLGHCIPLFALMPKADVFRAELAFLGAAPELFWVDCSSPSDWGSFALVDPVALCAEELAGVPVKLAAKNPRAMTSPRFHTLFDPVTYAALKRDKRRMHMQYLMAGDLPGAYDYFAWTAGETSLRERFIHKANV